MLVLSKGSANLLSKEEKQKKVFSNITTSLHTTELTGGGGNDTRYIIVTVIYYQCHLRDKQRRLQQIHISICDHIISMILASLKLI